MLSQHKWGFKFLSLALVLLPLMAAGGECLPPTNPTKPPPIDRTVYKAVSVTPINLCQDDVKGMPVNGYYSSSFSLGRGTVETGGTFRQTQPPEVGGDYWMLVTKTPLLPGATGGNIKVSQVACWYNHKPKIKGLNDTKPGILPIDVYQRVELCELLRWVPSANPSKPWYWRRNAELTEREKLLLSHVKHKEGNVGVQELPNLREGTITTLGASTDLFNCYAYAANSNNPKAIGWVAGPNGFPPGAKKHVVVKSVDDFINFYRVQGWQKLAEGSDMPPVPESGLIAVFRDSGGYLTHAALVTPTGVYAKMGRLGTFKFSSLQQMSGGYFGTPNLWFGRIP